MKLFTKVASSALDVVKRTIEVSSTDDNDVVVSFHTSRGRGTAPVVVAPEQYDDFVAALSFYAENGINKSEEAKTPADLVHETISVEDGIVSFRIRSGRGSKPTRIPQEEFASVVALLTEVSDGVQENAAVIREQLSAVADSDESEEG